MDLQQSLFDYAEITLLPQSDPAESDQPGESSESAGTPRPSPCPVGLESEAPRCVIVLGSAAPAPVQQIVRHINDALGEPDADVPHTTCRPGDGATEYSVLRRLLGLSGDELPLRVQRPYVLVLAEAQWCDRGTLRWIDSVMHTSADRPPTVLMTLSHRALTTADPTFHEIMSRDYCTVVDAADFLAAQAAGPDLEGLATHEPHLLRVVQAATILRSTDADLVSALAALPLRVVARALDDARELGLLHDSAPPAGAPDRVEAMAALSDAEAERLHARAAEILSDAARPAEQVADHLLERSALEPWMISILREAVAATRHDRPAAAVRYLSRLHSVDPTDDATLVELGMALLEIDPARAHEHLERALARTGLPRTAAALPTASDTATPVTLTGEAAAGLRLAALMTRRTPDTPRALSDLLRGIRDDPASRNLVPAAHALSAALAGTAMDDAVENAERVLSAERRPGIWATVAAAQTLGLADRISSALSHLESAAADARRREEPWAECHARSARALLLLESGALVQAAAEAAGALRIAERNGWKAEARLPVATLATIMLYRADLDRAEQMLQRIDDRELDGGSVWEHHYHLLTIGQLHNMRGRTHRSAAVTESCGASLAAAGVENPVFTTWWVHSAELLAQLGRADTAAERAEFGRRLARRWPTPRSTGLSLLADSAVAAPAERPQLLAESVRALAESSDRINHARAELRLGRAYFALGDKKAARTHLSAARRLAEGHGLLAVAVQADVMLGVAGGRVERGARSANDALSAAERPVAELAAAGATNRDIADSLFLTVRTVEYHLTNVYRKLGVAGRADLADRLAPAVAGTAASALDDAG